MTSEIGRETDSWADGTRRRWRFAARRTSVSSNSLLSPASEVAGCHLLCNEGLPLQRRDYGLKVIQSDSR
ncbi:uncharacterized protein ACO6RY_03790 [Pungitius sinensis]